MSNQSNKNNKPHLPTITCHLMGGLGNQLFQLFATISYSIQIQSKCIFYNTKTLGGKANGNTLRFTYWDSFLKRLQPFLVDPVDPLYSIHDFQMVKETGFEYHPWETWVPGQRLPNLCLLGYFQSYRYFEPHVQTILRMIGVEALKQQLLEKLGLGNGSQFMNATISLHFRIGDYVNLPDHHPIMSVSYYKKALQYIYKQIPSNQTWYVIYFCEDKDIKRVEVAIQELKSSFPSLHFLKVNPELSDWEQMLFMSCCHHHIIANSTFSWWGAYLNSRSQEDKIVCYPSVWFGKKIPHDTTDLFPQPWIKIEMEK